MLRRITDKHKITIPDSTWASDRPFYTRQIRADLASATLGQLDRYRILIEDDPQLNAALETFPRASKLTTQAVGSHP